MTKVLAVTWGSTSTYSFTSMGHKDTSLAPPLMQCLHKLGRIVYPGISVPMINGEFQTLSTRRWYGVMGSGNNHLSLDELGRSSSQLFVIGIKIGDFSGRYLGFDLILAIVLVQGMLDRRWKIGVTSGQWHGVWGS